VTTHLTTTRTTPATPTPAMGAAAPARVLVAGGSLEVGAGELLSVGLANALVSEGLEVYFAGSDGPLRNNLDRRVRYLPTDHPGHAPSRVTHELLLYIKHHAFDIIHSHNGTNAVLASFAARASHERPARVLTHHARVLRRAPQWVSRPVMKRCADHFVAINPDKRAELVSFGIADERISMFPGFVDVDAIAIRVAGVDRAAALRSLGIPEGARVLLMAGRVVAGRRFDQFIRIASEVARRQSDREIHALIVGDGPALEDARRVAVKEGAPARIHFLGVQRDLFTQLAVADVVVYPSEHPEAFPAFLVETSAAARPIVCSPLSSFDEIVTDGETGRVIAGGIADYADAIVELLEHPETGTWLAHAAQQRVLKAFDRPAVARATVAMYRDLLVKK
jgi:glycosyltransferase involved in cell wall biosynthesis